ncbi:hypothetical protein PG984_003931 [Apiospora sp. TS-2023a]
MNNPKTEASSSGQRQQAQRQQAGAADPAVPRSSSGMQMSDEVPKPQDSHDPMHFALHGRQYGGGDAMEGLSSGTLAAEGLPLSIAHKIRKDINDNGLLRPYPLAAGLQAAGGSSVGSTPMGSEAPTVSDDSQAEGDLHPFAAKIAEVKQQKQKQKEKGKQQQQQSRTAGHHHAPHITATALPSKVFNGEAWLLDPYGTGNNPLSSSDPRLRGTSSGAAAAASKGRTLGRDAGKGKQAEGDSGGLDTYGEMDTSHAGRASLASDGEIELPAQHEFVQDRLGSPGADDLGL